MRTKKKSGSRKSNAGRRPGKAIESPGRKIERLKNEDRERRGIIPPVETKADRAQPARATNAHESGVEQPDPFEQEIEAYGAHVWAYACAYAIATNLAGVNYPILKPAKVDGKDSFVENKTHLFWNVYNNPNPFMSTYQLLVFTFLNQELTGNAYWAIEWNEGKTKPLEFWPLPSHLVKPVAGTETLISHYLYRVGGRDIRYDLDEIIVFQEPDPANLYYGQGSVKPAKLSIISDLFLATWNKNFFKNNARPDSILESDEILDPEVRKRTIKAWKAVHQGAGKSHQLALLEDGLKYKEVNRTAKDMDFIALKKVGREEVLAAFGVPPVIVGVLEFANYANSKQQFENFWKTTLLPKIRGFTDTLTMRFKQLSLDVESFVEADLSQVEALRQDEKERAEIAQIYTNMGVPPNQVIEALNLPFNQFEGGDVSRQAAGAGFAAFPAGEAALDPAKVKAAQDWEIESEREWKIFDRLLAAQEDILEAVFRSFFGSQRRRVLRLLNQHGLRLVSQKSLRTKQDETISIDVIFDEVKEEERMAKAAEPAVRKTVFAFALREAKRIDPAFDFNLKDPRVEAFIDSTTVKLVKQTTAFTKETITDAVRESVRQAVAEGISDSDTIAEIRDRIDEAFKFARDTRSTRIARTEALAAANGGAAEGAKATGATHKTWLNSRDGKVRDSHRFKSTVRIDEDFVTKAGNKLAHPGDKSAPPSETVQCRCTAIYRRLPNV